LSRFDYAIIAVLFGLLFWTNTRIGTLAYQLKWMGVWQGGIIRRLERLEGKKEQGDERSDQ
jgi:hypothetical protein